MVRIIKLVKRGPLLAAATVVFCLGITWAHAILVASIPGANAIVDGPSIDITLKFNVRVDTKRSSIRLLSADRGARSVAVLPGKASNVILARAVDLGPGKYKLSWQVLASDGHITRGEIPFSVR
jgi:methionine-rich copper-binding protein CopC